MASLRERAGRLAQPVAVVAGTAAWVVGAFLNDLSGWGLAATVSLGAALTALAVGLPMLDARRAGERAATAEQIARDVEARMQLVLDDALEPLAYLIGRITDSREGERQELQGQATIVVLAAAAEVLGAARLRSCFFALAPDGSGLYPAGFHGRAAQPRSVFLAGTPLGDYALGMLDRREDLFCPDTAAADTPPGWQPGGHDYRTFLAVPVATEATAFGIMTIDGLQVGDLTAEDVTAARVFARLLAAALNA